MYSTNILYDSKVFNEQWIWQQIYSMDDEYNSKRVLCHYEQVSEHDTKFMYSYCKCIQWTMIMTAKFILFQQQIRNPDNMCVC